MLRYLIQLAVMANDLFVLGIAWILCVEFGGLMILPAILLLASYFYHHGLDAWRPSKVKAWLQAAKEQGL